MPFIARQEPFTCGHCSAVVTPLPHGTYRNHCPLCLWSKHVDDQGPGDRSSLCQELMEPVALDQDGKKGWMVLHRCTACGKEIRNKCAPDDDISAFTYR
ncbi:MAG: RNHCP domain-containing protein [Candidatus Peribacteraceae bacterium]|jgi:hypothetical protein